MKKTKQILKKNSPDKNTLLKSDGNFKNNNYLFRDIYHIRHINNDIGITPEADTFIPLSNRKQEIRLNQIHKRLLNDYRFTNNNSDNYLKKFLDYSKHNRRKILLFLININEKNSRSVSLNNRAINNSSLHKAKSNNNNEKNLKKKK